MDPDRGRESNPPETDAMGLDKRRRVRGGVYGPTRARIAAQFAIVIAVVIIALVAARIAVDRLDRPPKEDTAEAPWAEPDAPQRPPRPLQ